MSFLDLFKSRESRAKLSHVKSLLALALADGKIEESELLAIGTICRREGISDTDLKRCIDDPSSIKFVAPQSDEERIVQLTDMVALMMCDGNIDNKELDICKLMAKALGYAPEVIDVLILKIMADLKEKLEK